MEHKFRFIAPLFAILILVGLALNSTWAFAQDRQPALQPADRIEQVDVDQSPAREDFIPFAETVLTVLDRESDEGNALLEMTIPSEARKSTGRATSSLRVPATDDAETVTRDDGLGGDREAGDGVFSAVVKLSKEELEIVQKFPNPLKRPASLTHPVDFDRELMITNLSVVEDKKRTFDPCTGVGTPMGAWTFGRLMKEMSTTQDPRDFVQGWLKTWTVDQNGPNVNGFLAEQRTAIIDLINNWPKDRQGKLDLSRAPMRLLAIVFRPDLRNAPAGYGGGASAGEGRFVFGVFDPENISGGYGTIGTEPGECGALPFTVILEYELLADNFCSVRDWGRDIHNLSLITNQAKYNARLQELTDRFTLANVAPRKPNGSAINQVRTNEIALDVPWELREFNVTKYGWLDIVTVKQTPDEQTFNDTVTLQNFMNSNATSILMSNHTVPAPWNGASSKVPFSPAVVWQSVNQPTDPQVRHMFALNTCNGCHFNETNNIGNGGTNTFFTHIDPRTPGNASTLSAFLQGPIVVDDPATADFWNHDEPERRITNLISLVNATCFEVPMVSAVEERIH